MYKRIEKFCYIDDTRIEYTIHKLNNGRVYCKTTYRNWYFCFPVKFYKNGISNIIYEISKFRHEIACPEFCFKHMPRNSTITQLSIDDL